MRRGKFQGTVWRGHVYIVSASARHRALPHALPQDICCLSSSFESLLLLLTAFAFGYEGYHWRKVEPHVRSPIRLDLHNSGVWYWPNTGPCGSLDVGLSG